MEVKETTATKRRSWQWAKWLIVIVAATALVYFAFSPAPRKNEIIGSLPAQRPLARFLTRLPQPISDAWQQFRQVWAKSPVPVTFQFYPLDTASVSISRLGNPILTNEAGIVVWLVPTETAMGVVESGQTHGQRRYSSIPATNQMPIGRPNSLKKSDTVFEGNWSRVCTSRSHQGLCRAHISDENTFDIDMFLEPTLMGPRDSNRISRSYVPTNHPILKPFGVQMTVPKGSSIAIRGPDSLPPGVVRYGGVLIVK